MDDLVDSLRVRDLDMAAFLCVRGHELISIEPDGSECFWHFIDGETLRKDVLEFGQGDSVCEPRALLLTHKRMRREMFEVLDGRRPA